MIRRWVESEKEVEGSVGRCAVRLCLAVLCLARGIQVCGESLVELEGQGFRRSNDGGRHRVSEAGG